MYQLRRVTFFVLVVILSFACVVGAEDSASSAQRDRLIAEHMRRRDKLEQQLEDARQKVVGYEDGELDMPESTYMRYAQRVTMSLKKLERMKAMDESEIIELMSGESSRDL
mmetsp:Transcript_123658/g.184939  ORF Transcript_123658/g.184939 Transcript_123658/m.184939 type:complete len:111 (-) Transcript_123658:192-524(-)